MVLGFTHSYSAPHWRRAVCAIAANNQLLSELKYTFLVKKWKKKESDFKAYNNQTSNDNHTCYKYKKKKMSPTHNWTHFEAEEKSLILSLVLYLLCPSNPIAPSSLSLFLSILMRVFN